MLTRGEQCRGGESHLPDSPHWWLLLLQWLLLKWLRLGLGDWQWCRLPGFQSLPLGQSCASCGKASTRGDIIPHASPLPPSPHPCQYVTGPGAIPAMVKTSEGREAMLMPSLSQCPGVPHFPHFLSVMLLDLSLAYTGLGQSLIPLMGLHKAVKLCC